MKATSLRFPFVVAFWVLSRANASLPSEGVPSSLIPFERADQIPDEAYTMVAKSRVIWFGEMHGTKEAPLLFLGLVRLISRNDQPPVVAIEFPHVDQAGIDDYLKNGDISILASRTLFHRKPDSRDGRTSRAMMELLVTLRSESVARVVCFDPSPNAESGQDRDDGMAIRLARSAEEYPKAKVVVLSGGVHSSVVVGFPWDPNYRPAGFELSKRVGPIVNFELRYGRGTTWSRNDDGFRERAVNGEWMWPSSGTAPYYISLEPTTVRGHQGGIFTRTITSSPSWP